MTAILTDPSPDALALAIEANMDASFALAVRHGSGIEIQESPAMTRYASGLPCFLANGVIHIRLTSETLADTVQQTLTYFRERNLPMQWLVSPSSEPAELGSVLEQHTPIQINITPGMAIDLQTLPEAYPLPANTTIREVEEDAMLEDWIQALAAGYGLPPEVCALFASAPRVLGYGEGVALRNFIAYQDGVPVATSSLCLGAGVAGIYCVSTVPDARYQGIGTAVAATPLCAARAQGYRFGTLQASKMGLPIYRRMGFEEYCAIRMYIFDLTTNTE